MGWGQLGDSSVNGHFAYGTVICCFMCQGRGVILLDRFLIV